MKVMKKKICRGKTKQKEKPRAKGKYCDIPLSLFI